LGHSFPDYTIFNLRFILHLKLEFKQMKFAIENRRIPLVAEGELYSQIDTLLINMNASDNVV